MSFRLTTPIKEIKGIGRQKEKCFEKLGIKNIENLIFYFPRKYINLKKIEKISQLTPGEILTVKGYVITREEKKLLNRTSYLKIAVNDGTGILYVIFFNQLYLKNIFQQGKQFLFHGKVEYFNNNFEMINPLYEEYEKGKKFDWILPVYPLTKGLTQKFMRKLIKYVFKNLSEFPEEILPVERRLFLGISNIKHALKNIHFPLSEINLEKARNYLILREFFILQLNIMWRKNIEQKGQEEVLLEIDENLIYEFEKILPFDLTDNQKEVMREIIMDLKNGKLIRRLINGEVGSGKTTIAIFALWIFARMNFQGVFLCPTEILAQQHFLNWNEFFLKQDISITLLTGNLKENEKEIIRKDIENGKIKVVIGTHAVLSEKINFNNLKIVIIDEQHKFGVKQQEILKEKSKNIHYITMSATPIPRTLALVLYGNMDVSIMGELPKGKRQVITYLFSKKDREKIYSFIDFQISQNKTGFVVAPAVKGNEDIESVEKIYNQFQKRLSKPDKIGLIHGKMSAGQQETVLKKLKNKEINLLVATTVIESGIDVPFASFIIIEQAERFGLSQLHQLRGRVGRTGEMGYCFLVIHDEDEEINKKMESFIEKETGFEIAELDLNLRGPGDILGTRQHGLLPLKIGDITKDVEMLKLARKEVERILKMDPKLEKMKYLRKFIKNG